MTTKYNLVPLAWVTADTVVGQSANGKPRRIWWENSEDVGIPIYTTPQPSPEVAKLVEAADMALKEIECALNEAYNNAGSVCCQRPSFGKCCGEPDPAWSAADEAIIDRFAPHHRALEEAIRAYRKQGGDI